MLKKNSIYTIPVLEGLMQKINGYAFYDIGSAMHPLVDIKKGATLNDIWFLVYQAKDALISLLGDQLVPLVVSKGAIGSLRQLLNSILPDDTAKWGSMDFEKEVEVYLLQQIGTHARNFETIFSAELQNMATYFVSKKGIYDTNDLIAKADDMFTQDVKKHLSERVMSDIREAGKCLAFDLGTAAGFHIARAVEQVLTDYIDILNPGSVANIRESQRNLGNYIKIAKDNNGDEKVCSCLDQFRDLHRNPLIHPESVLTIDQALTLLGIAQSAIVSMTIEMERLKQVMALPLLSGSLSIPAPPSLPDNG